VSVIPPVDLTGQFRTIQSDVNAAVAEVLASGQYINGPIVETFAKAFGEYVGTDHCIVCATQVLMPYTWRCDRSILALEMR
jgi:dTDP-4-amino-4,6-dideoxygalactose transaminase